MPNSGAPVAVDLPLLWPKVAGRLSAASGAGVVHLNAAGAATHLHHELRIVLNHSYPYSAGPLKEA